MQSVIFPKKSEVMLFCRFFSISPFQLILSRFHRVISRMLLLTIKIDFKKVEESLLCLSNVFKFTLIYHLIRKRLARKIKE